MSNIIITGLHRSGTSLTCHLLNSVPDTVALLEPMVVKNLSSSRHGLAVGREVEQFFSIMRNSILREGTAVSKQVNGIIPVDPIESYGESLKSPASLYKKLSIKLRKQLGTRRNRAFRGTIQIEKLLTKDFSLCIKHPAAFTAALPTLHSLFPCFAVVRNPLAILGSWNSIDFAPGRGRAPAAERLDPELANNLQSIENRFDRQLHLLSWSFGKYEKVLPRENVFKYEDIIASRGQVLRPISGDSTGFDKVLENRNLNQAYDPKLMVRLGEKLLKTGGPYWDFYSRKDIEDLINDFQSKESHNPHTV